MFFSSVAHAGTFMPPAATDIAKEVDHLYAFLLIVSFIASAMVIGGFIYFAIKYRRRSPNDQTPHITHNNILEFLWSFIPLCIFLVAFVWGWVVYSQLRHMPTTGLQVAVEAQQWNWTFIYKNGRKSAGELWVPVNTPVKFVMASKDVIHSMFIPAFRYKQDVVPGRYTTLWFKANEKGVFQIFCAQFCGRGHSAMLGKIHVVSREDFDRWLENDPYKGLSLADIGHKVYASRCIACHNTTHEKKVGPGFGGIWGTKVAFSNHDPVVVDENYIRESVENPNAKVVKGFPSSVMPVFKGQLSDQEIMGVIEFIKSLK